MNLAPARCPSLLLQSQPAAARVTPRAQPAGAFSRACDLAHQAYRQAQEADRSRSLPEAGIAAFKEAIQINPAFLFHEDLFYRYLGAALLVSRPPVADQPIKAVEIRYAWAGPGDPLRYSLRIDDANASPQVTLSDFEGSSTPDVRRMPADTVQALASALTDFVPVSAPRRFVNCTDNAPDWTITLHFRDGSVLTLVTSRSNTIPLGGPWQMQLDGVWYVQLSNAFADAVRDLVDAAKLPPGRPAGMFCFPAPVFIAVYGE